MNLWEKGVHDRLVGYIEAEMEARESKDSRDDDEEDIRDKTFHRT